MHTHHLHKQRFIYLLYLYLNHQTSLSAESDDVAIDVHPALRLQTLHHGIDANVGAGPANSRAAQD